MCGAPAQMGKRAEFKIFFAPRNSAAHSSQPIARIKCPTSAYFFFLKSSHVGRFRGHPGSFPAAGTLHFAFGNRKRFLERGNRFLFSPKLKKFRRSKLEAHISQFTAQSLQPAAPFFVRVLRLCESYPHAA